ncbi:NAD(+)/NADH kinase [Candidatus Formimonas warabiya]|uniref:NAD kinase n=1 Tax=Formimonas warabiya TaxID=1761012 RepID=A0A3G1KNL9_FORW1|nr:NAD(+)/NADH kinase [Candidatus Formimonas warabiya]ATW24059.1 NAD(+) kinase [Candidatus Formimonas warabiya]
MKSVGLVINLKKQNALEVADKIKNWFINREIVVKEYKQNFHHQNNGSALFSYKSFEDVDLILVLGGDGTLLNTARTVAPFQIPLLGINMGYLGFLTEVDLEDLFFSLEKLVSGEYRLEERMMLRCELKREGTVMDEFFALNDIVVAKGPFSRMILFDTYVEDQYIDTFSADGIIVSTPTGSTAYSLSAGGPIVSPEMDLMLITPICPHTLYSRPMVIGSEKSVRIVLKSESAEVMLTVDGQHGYRLVRWDEIIVKKSSLQTKLVRFQNKTFYDILRKKLRESGGNNRL